MRDKVSTTTAYPLASGKPPAWNVSRVHTDLPGEASKKGTIKVVFQTTTFIKRLKYMHNGLFGCSFFLCSVRQRKRWEDNIREWTGLEFAKSQGAVENMEKWRKLVVKSSVVPQRPSWLRDKWDETMRGNEMMLCSFVVAFFHRPVKNNCMTTHILVNWWGKTVF